MKFINSASNASRWRGLDYHKNKKVKNIVKINENEYTSKVIGSNEHYNVYLNLEKVKESTCNCPLAKGRKVICKHKVATYFTILPSEVDVFLKEVEEHNKMVDEYNDNLRKDLVRHLNGLPKKELVEEILTLLDDSPEWVYDRYVRDHL